MEQIKLLSRREKEVVILLLQGKSNKQIALSLEVSERTIEFHLKNVYTKLQVNSRVELILKLGKTTVGFTEKLGESTVDVLDKSIHNGKQSAIQNRWTQPLKNIIFTIQKEFAMIRIVVSEDVRNFLKIHPVFLGLLSFLAISLITRYLIIDFGLYFWLSYILLGLFLGAGSIYFGLSWSKVADGKINFRPLVIALITMPIIVALTDVILLHTVAKNAKQVSITIGLMTNKAMWLVSPDGSFYLYRERLVMNDDLWLYATLCMVLLFFISVLANKRLAGKRLASV
ncbi:MAG: hypothetical protein KatS3mg087_2144 [Patescibacteria group bacterium]|nr:MAG: hypothetical protein KatS3mg087_2144 [Patescibacteria group bacterium]